MDVVTALVDKARTELREQDFTEDVSNKNYELNVFYKISGVDKVFRGVSFKYVVFDDCYFRNCQFINCNFTGAQFKDSSFRGSTFPNSIFDYSRFRNTRITSDLVSRNLPGYENVALEFAQSLRVNFAQIGDVKGVNRAIVAELNATKDHLHKAAWNPDRWYRNKYAGIHRFKAIWDSFLFNCLDFIWGNGESSLKLTRTILILLLLIVLIVYLADDLSIFESFHQAFGMFIGSVDTPSGYAYLPAVVGLFRYVLLGMFVSVLVRRLSRR